MLPVRMLRLFTRGHTMHCSMRGRLRSVHHHYNVYFLYCCVQCCMCGRDLLQTTLHWVRALKVTSGHQKTLIKSSEQNILFWLYSRLTSLAYIGTLTSQLAWWFVQKKLDKLLRAIYFLLFSQHGCQVKKNPPTWCVCDATPHGTARLGNHHPVSQSYHTCFGFNIFVFL